MPRARTFAAAALMLCTASAGGRSAQSEITVGDWRIFSNPTNCRAIAPVGDGTIASVTLFAGNSRTAVMFLDNRLFASVTDLQPIEARLAFVTNYREDAAWARLPVVGMVAENGTKGVVIGADGDGLLNSFGNSEFVVLRKGNGILLHFRSGPAAGVVAALRKCVGAL
jgi:hypothetical protein